MDIQTIFNTIIKKTLGKDLVFGEPFYLFMEINNIYTFSIDILAFNQNFPSTLQLLIKSFILINK